MRRAGAGVNRLGAANEVLTWGRDSNPMSAFEISLRRAQDPSGSIARGMAGAFPQAEKTVAARAEIRLARHKADFVNKFIRANQVTDVIDYGCGDTRLLRQLRVPALTGICLAAERLAACRAPAAANPGWRFYAGPEVTEEMTASMALSVDMVGRLETDADFSAYMRALFRAGRDYVLIHAAQTHPAWAASVLNLRPFTDHVRRFFPSWRLAAHVPNPVPHSRAADFFVYARPGAACLLPVLPPV